MIERGRSGGGRSGEVLFEFTQLGHQMRVAAIDAATSLEVVVIAPLTATRLQMQNLALAKLRRRLAEQGRGAERRLF
ncbi:MAG TPA: serine hydroxymethyltransferase [Devosiaceae bacterium]|nr:serine hydroxymethyltransferase [Devosiaceae bacterium]